MDWRHWAEAGVLIVRSKQSDTIVFNKMLSLHFGDVRSPVAFF